MIIKMSEGYEIKQEVLDARVQARIDINRLEKEVIELSNEVKSEEETL